MKVSNKLTLCFYAFLGCATITQAADTVTVPMLDDAKIFANFTDKMPAVVNFYTKNTEQDIISFYKQKYGEVLTQQRKRGRLTLVFTQENKNIRVVISPQNKMREVDVLIENKS